MGILDLLMPKDDVEKAIYEAKKLRKLNEKDALYQFEHISFRKLFFETGQPFVESLIKDDNFPFFIYSKQCSLMRQSVKYTKEQFVLTAHSNDSDQIIFKLIPPEPYRCPLCYEIHMIVDFDGNALKYETLEKDMTSTIPLLCQWNKDGSHYNLGPIDENYSNMPLHDLELMYASNFSDIKLQHKSINSTNNATENAKTSVNSDFLDKSNVKEYITDEITSNIKEDITDEITSNVTDSHIENLLMLNDFEMNLINDYFNNQKVTTEEDILTNETGCTNEEIFVATKAETSNLYGSKEELDDNLDRVTKFCRYCGTKLVDNACFCHKCGKKL